MEKVSAGLIKKKMQYSKNMYLLPLPCKKELKIIIPLTSIIIAKQVSLYLVKRPVNGHKKILQNIFIIHFNIYKLLLLISFEQGICCIHRIQQNVGER